MINRFNIDFSDLVIAIQTNEKEHINNILRLVVPILIDYLQIHFQASTPDAEDCVHTALADVIEQVRKSGVQDKRLFYRYLLKATKNEYLKIIRKEKIFAKSGLNYAPFEYRAEQLEQLIEEERQRILRQCLGRLHKSARSFIEFFLRHPELNNQEVADELDLTYSNVRVKKMRITRILHECYKRKSGR